MLDLHAATAFCPPTAPPGGVEVVLGALVVGAVVLGAVVLAPPVLLVFLLLLPQPATTRRAARSTASCR